MAGAEPPVKARRLWRNLAMLSRAAVVPSQSHPGGLAFAEGGFASSTVLTARKHHPQARARLVRSGGAHLVGLEDLKASGRLVSKSGR
ncbi:hypothetical protein CMUS01_09160 [Colletotrichum musicola]|uniref:Uncharacterized protein n=1 Tax=Colletotrichum musicola TaxID=2175873 RepID=A0A8H6NC17_9PEZI|nr:hypothetical protein CMUS01_09160 [Colletotrichum musicola]